MVRAIRTKHVGDKGEGMGSAGWCRARETWVKTNSDIDICIGAMQSHI